MRIGSFEGSSWNGITLVDKDFSFSFRFGCFFDGKMIDGGQEIYQRVTEVGPNAPDSPMLVLVGISPRITNLFLNGPQMRILVG